MNLFAKRFKELRQEKRIYQYTIAKEFGVARTTITSWETGRSEPSFDQLLLLADYFNVTTDYLLGKTDY